MFNSIFDELKEVKCFKKMTDFQGLVMQYTLKK